MNDFVRRWPSSDVLLGAIGYGMAIALFYIVFFGDALVDIAYGSSLSGVPVLAGLSALLICTVLSLRYSDRLSQIGTRKLLFPSALVLASAFGVSAFMEQAGIASIALSCIVWAVAGVALALFLTVWSEYVANREKETLLASFIIAFAVAGAGMVAVSFLEPTARLVALIAAPLLSAVFFVTMSQGIESGRFVTRRESSENMHLDWRSSLSYSIIGVVIGSLIQSIGRSFPASGALLEPGWGVLGAVVVSMLVIRAKSGSWILLGPVERITFPLLVALLLTLPFVSGPAAVGCVVVLMTVLFMRDLARIVNRSILAIEFEAQSCHLYSRTALPFYLGLSVGVVLDLIFALAVPSFYAIASSLVLTVLLSVGIAVVPYGADPLTMPFAPSPAADEGLSDDHIGQGLWRKACEHVAESVGLTPRECEIFHLLSRGRSATVIARELGISVYTVKSHTYNVYRKLDIEAQQDLIDRVQNERMQIKREIEEPHVRL